MTTTDEKRRAFLLGAGGAAGAGVAGAALPTQVLAQKVKRNGPAEPEAHHMHVPAGGFGAFFNEDDAAAVTAFAERLMPGAPGKPGARDCGVLNYIDLALSGAYAGQQDFYRRGLAALEAYCRKTYSRSFARLSAAQQDETITALETGKATEFTWPTPQAFFNTMRVHTMEGMFADPVYGGNRNFAGWRLIGFPGAQPNYDAADLASRQAFTRVPITGLQGQAGAVRNSNRKA